MVPVEVVRMPDQTLLSDDRTPSHTCWESVVTAI